ncbi:amidohydrolase family protein [Spirulina sp. CCNP1310]|uniref:amidohydrolase family protein n=1 Tax=Spirulina sp. CCNP1310 TaxID=3110249 RepID=UPI002B21BEAD|nr:amidohydrolase family protein [Spirulina sp. CCNP1310]MEA5418050.1 amidohydrolase family protein [Spirulina sp. CCNP1310]
MCNQDADISSYRKISADYIYTISGPVIEYGMVTLDSYNTIVSISQREVGKKDDLEIYEGIIIPGFINAHCHLELSHLRDKTPRNVGGLIPFIEGISALRKAEKSEIINAIECEEQKIIEAGIVAVGDLSNTTYTFYQKSLGNIRYHTFIEILGGDSERAVELFDRGRSLYQIMPTANRGSKSIVPHAPYNTSPELLHLIKNFSMEFDCILSIHNQECKAEELFFKAKTGAFVDLYERINAKYDFFEANGENSLHYTLHNLLHNNQLLLVHNIFTSIEDIQYAVDYAEKVNGTIYWVMCPNSNLYIEGVLPDIPSFVTEGATIAIGTDSLASNFQLSVLEELKTINRYFPNIPIHSLLKWATLNGAKSLNYDSDLGSIEIGKRSGLNLLTGVDLANNSLQKAEVKKLT